MLKTTEATTTKIIKVLKTGIVSMIRFLPFATKKEFHPIKG
jgi:hypothetical protein